MNDLINSLINNIGPGRMASTAYDTAWVGRLIHLDPTLGHQALDWISSNQLPDGSWGAAAPMHYHDRVISTLAALITLTKFGRRTTDRKRVERGVRALGEIVIGASRGLMANPLSATIGYEMIIPTLVAEAETLGLIQQQSEKILRRLSHLRSRKIAKIQGSLINRHTTMAFSAEMAGSDGQHMLDVEHLQEANGSVGHSPSATAYYTLYVNDRDQRALDYLHQIVQKDGGFPNVSPFDAFEISWSLWNLNLIPGFETTPRVQDLLGRLADAWQPGRGIGFATQYSVKDSDMTSFVFDTLHRYGTAKDIESILVYEEHDHFRCYPLEVDPSISANIHILGALRQARFECSHPSVQKIVRFLKEIKGGSRFWIDKWHSSPYYTTSHAIIACAGYLDDLVRDSVDWLLETQQPSGAWGTYLPTAEETAYAIQALWTWDQYSGRIDPKIIRRAAAWLEEQIDEPYPPLWIGKCLYSPNLVIRSAVVSALTLKV